MEEAFETFRLISQDAGILCILFALDQIDHKKLELCMKTAGFNPTREQVQQMIKQLDTLGKGYVTFEEFMEMMKEKEVDIFVTVL